MDNEPNLTLIIFDNFLKTITKSIFVIKSNDIELQQTFIDISASQFDA